ncbi:MAG: hypothetical protein WAO83_26110 [Fuerstiella sp.]
MKTLIITAVSALSLMLACTLEASAQDSPAYSLDSMTQHPYRFTPAWGHASHNPGSPKWFVPGYGYQIPGYGYSVQRYSLLSPYNAHYAFGIRQRSGFGSPSVTPLANVGAPPWYFPGSPAGVQLNSFAW